MIIYANRFIEVGKSDLTRGLLVNHQEFGDGRVLQFLPEQARTGSEEHDVDAPEEATPTDDAVPEEDWARVRQPVFWAKWKLFWCKTADHDEDWFVVARVAWEAAAFFEDYEGYDRGDASAKFVCALPDSEQINAEAGPMSAGWPSSQTLLACGAEFLSYAPDDDLGKLRMQVGSGVRAVRLNERLFVEGDIVSNTTQRVDTPPDA